MEMYYGKRRTSNLFNAKNISNTAIKVSEEGSQIIMPVATSGTGYTSTGAKFNSLCPEVKVDDTLYLNFGRMFVDGEESINGTNAIALMPSGKMWNRGSSLTITEELLNSTIIFYGNHANNGETKQVILKDFRITKEQNTPFKPYSIPNRVKAVKRKSFTKRITVRNPKNLIPFPYKFTTKTTDGVIINVLKNGQFSMVGKNTTGTYINVLFQTVTNLPVGEYTISLPSIRGVRCLVQKRVNGAFISNYNIGWDMGRNELTFSVTEDEKVNSYEFNISIQKNFSFDTPVEFGIVLNEGATAEPYFVEQDVTYYVPVICDIELPIDTQTNLIPFPYYAFSSRDVTSFTTNGITYTLLDDGGIYVKGTATTHAYCNLTGTYGNGIDLGSTTIYVYEGALSNSNGSYCLSKSGSGANKTYMAYDANNESVWIRINLNVTVDGVVYPKLNRGDKPTPWYPRNEEVN